MKAFHDEKVIMECGASFCNHAKWFEEVKHGKRDALVELKTSQADLVMPR